MPETPDRFSWIPTFQVSDSRVPAWCNVLYRTKHDKAVWGSRETGSLAMVRALQRSLRSAILPAMRGSPGGRTRDIEKK